MTSILPLEQSIKSLRQIIQGGLLLHKSLLDDLDIDLFVLVVSYLSITDIFSHLSLTDKTIAIKILERRNLICYEKAIDFLNGYGRINDSGNISRDLNWYNILQRMTCWPTDFDFCSVKTSQDNLYDKIAEVKRNDGYPSRCIAYQGVRHGGNRCVVSDCHFPAIPLPTIHSVSQSGVIIRSNLPFTKIIASPSTYNLTFSLVAYFEIKIFDPIIPNSNRNTSNHHSISDWLNQTTTTTTTTAIATASVTTGDAIPCVCIGLCLAGFNIGSHMPGWRANSFGYHGDDGNLFHGSSTHNASITTNITPSTFGAGDTVGCGLFYPPLGRYGRGGIFYTKNGQIVAEYSFVNIGVLANAWYPVVGTDCYNPIEMNCGKRPFAFDISSYENQLVLRTCPTIDVELFRRTGYGIEHLLNENTVGYTTAIKKYTHPAIKNPWNYFNKYVIPSYKINDTNEYSKLKLSQLLQYTNLSFFSGALYRDTRDFNRHRPCFVESIHDVYGDLLYFDTDDEISIAGGDDENEEEENDEDDEDDFDEDDFSDYSDEEYDEEEYDDEDDYESLDDYIEADGHEMVWPCGGLGDKYDEVGDNEENEVVDNTMNDNNNNIIINNNSNSSNFNHDDDDTTNSPGSRNSQNSSRSTMSTDPRQAISAVIHGLQKSLQDFRDTIRHQYDQQCDNQSKKKKNQENEENNCDYKEEINDVSHVEEIYVNSIVDTEVRSMDTQTKPVLIST